MKKIFLAVGVMLIAATVTFAHTNFDRRDRKEARKEMRKERRAENRTEVSVMTQNNFFRDFPEAKNVGFSRTNQFDEVYFTDGQKNLKAYYDYSSELVGTTENKTFADIPASAQKEILKYYPGYNIAGVVRFDDNETNSTDMVLFETPFEDADNYFVDLKKDNKETIVRVNNQGEVSFFKSLK